ncbi:MAG: hypothetical protein KBE23_22200 [Chloroflexi bacterium]|nr:hypothetical protein [Chloroflexota bacterium]MBP7045479.1 hypothetical protein [Chloroflexota bacterium]
MSKNAKIILTLVIVALVGGLAGLSWYYANLTDHLSQHETIILGQSDLVPGSTAALRVAVRDSRDAAPLPGATVSVRLQAPDGSVAAIYDALTDDLGTADVTLAVPDGEQTDYTLIVETKSTLGDDRIERPITLSRDYRILLTTDKPLYQPGQIIHLRALALSTFDRVPAAGQDLQIAIADGKGNTVFRQTVSTSAFGVASADFQLAGEVNNGPYKINATLGDTASEKTVTVERYALPKFDLTLTTDRAYYRPGDVVRGSLNATYFYGKPVADSPVTLEGFTFDFERQDALNLQATTDAQGNYEFEFTLPAFIVGSDLEGGLGTFYLQASVTDKANQTEAKQLSLPVSEQGLIIEAIPEGGQFRPEVENLLYVLVSTPDGAPAPADLDVTWQTEGQVDTAVTNPYGLAQLPITPTSPYQQFVISAQDSQGRSASQAFNFDGGVYQAEAVLLRPDKPIYQVGETMNLTILTSAQSGAVYLDLSRDGQTVSTRALPITDGQTLTAVDVTPDLFGTLELHAYKILRDGTIIRDTRLVLVDEANDLALTLSPDKEEYRPGDTAVLTINTAGQTGEGVSSAIGLAVVDEAVFALAEQDPGFAKLYFMLEQALLQPKYDLHGFSVPDLIGTEPAADADLRAAQEGAAAASLAAAPQSVNFSLQANSHDDAMQLAAERQDDYFTTLSGGLFALMLAVAAAIGGITAVAVWRAGSFWKKLGTAVGLGIVSLIFLYGLVMAIDEYFWRSGDTIMALLALACLGSFVALLVIAWRKKERALSWGLWLLLTFVVLLPLMVIVSDRGSFYPDDAWLWVTIAVLLLIPLAFLLHAAGFAWEKRWGTAVLALVVSLGAAAVPLAGTMASQVGGVPGGFAGNARMDDVMVEPMVEMAVAELPPMATDVPASADKSAQGSEPPRLRQYFPETMFWLPDGETDAAGNLVVDIPVADSITTWRMTALASSQDGRLGSATGGLRVFQEFFVDLNLPLALTVGDEIAVPVGVFNYLPDAQTVRLVVEDAGWFTLLDESEKSIDIAANDIEVVYFRIRADQFGRQPFTVTAWGSTLSDAIRKEVQVMPNGKEIRGSESGRLAVDEPIQTTVTIPVDAIPGTQGITVKIYPGVVSQVVEGLDSMLRMPNGCFEQTSSSTYPNVLVLDYLQASGQVSPEVQFKAEDYINIGYQRLTTFEVDGGGFSLFGYPPADRMLTSYGLQEFSDMSRVFEIDPALVDRAARWLLDQQQSDGSWENDQGLVHESTWSNLQNDRLPVTAYVIWSLTEAGYGSDSGTQRGLDYVRQHANEADDPYVLALVANALVVADLSDSGQIGSQTQSVLDQLAGMAKPDDSGGVAWTSGVASYSGSQGETSSIETTAMAALALLRAKSHADVANAALTSLIAAKDSYGTWYNTQATVLSLKALIETVRSGSENTNATVTITFNDGQTRTVEVTPENYDVVQQINYTDVGLGDGVIGITVQGEGSLMYQVTSSFYLPWDKLTSYPELVEPQEAMSVDVSYDRTELAVNESVAVGVTVMLNGEGTYAKQALIDLGIPPGFAVNSEDLAALVAQYNQTVAVEGQPSIQRYELTGRQILIYLNNLSGGQPLSFSYRLTAQYPLRAQTPASSAYDYYNPDVTGENAPQVLVVEG